MKNANFNKIGWRFENSYCSLPQALLSHVDRKPVIDPKLVYINKDLCRDLDLNIDKTSADLMAEIFSGNSLPDGAASIAQAYAGHQFGYFTFLGDGRALLIGEHKNKRNQKFDVQLKGSGKTPYSRNGDGKAALGPVLREYIISEAMHSLGVPTTRALAVVKTGEKVFRESELEGAVLTRVASSHIRVGTFEFLAASEDIASLRTLTKYSLKRHFPNKKIIKNCAISLLESVIEKQAELIIEWMRIGFVHGVMNTDNVTISGETIDYGPCAFMDKYNLNAVFSSIDSQGRYSYGNQPTIAHWNLVKFAESLLPIIDDNKKRAIKIAEEQLSKFVKKFNDGWFEMMRKKIGIKEKEKEDKDFIISLLSILQNNSADYTNFFISLSYDHIMGLKVYSTGDFLKWKEKWKNRIKLERGGESDARLIMKKNNPVFIPRNNVVEDVLLSIEKNGDYEPMNKFCNILRHPYEYKKDKNYYMFPSKNMSNYKTFCGT